MCNGEREMCNPSVNETLGGLHLHSVETEDNSNIIPSC